MWHFLQGVLDTHIIRFQLVVTAHAGDPVRDNVVGMRKPDRSRINFDRINVGKVILEDVRKHIARDGMGATRKAAISSKANPIFRFMAMRSLRG